MPEAIRTRSDPRASHVTLNSDGRHHPLLNGLTAFCFLAGISALAFGFLVSAHLAATVIGLVGLVVGLWTQLISATREERIFIVAGIVAAFVGMGMGIAHGGFG